VHATVYTEDLQDDLVCRALGLTVREPLLVENYRCHLVPSLAALLRDAFKLTLLTSSSLERLLFAPKKSGPANRTGPKGRTTAIVTMFGRCASINQQEIFVISTKVSRNA
jgi:hypothetical protein